MAQGKFITFEGGEGSGKSTQSEILKNHLIDLGYEVIKTREPGGTQGAEKIRKLLVEGDQKTWDAKTELLLHFAARNDHISKLIIPSLKQGKIVICDRFLDSTTAYQGFGHKLEMNIIRQLQDLVIGSFRPDLTFIFDIDVKTGIKRANSRNSIENRYESMGYEFHERVREGFLQISQNETDRCLVINSNQEIDTISQEVISKVTRIL